MLRSITLSLLMLISLGIMIPFVSSDAHGLGQSHHASRRRHHRHRHHSRAWWRRHRAMLRRRAAARAHRNAAVAGGISKAPVNNIASTAALFPQLPAGWNGLTPSSNAEIRFKTDNGNGVAPGQAALSVVAMSRPSPGYIPSRERAQLLGGVSFSDLRRIVIDKMVSSDGWVTNDYERDVAGHRVFVVTAKTPDNGRSPEKFWNFYFTEVNGRIYTLTTSTPAQSANRMASEAEQLIGSLHTGPQTTAQPDKR